MIERPPPRRPATLRLSALVEAPAAARVIVGVPLLAAFVSRVLLDRFILAPWKMVDQLQHASSARSLISNRHYLFRDYPEAPRTINAALMNLGPIPLYLCARRLAVPLRGVLAVLLYLVLLGFAYTGDILTENAFVPLTVVHANSFVSSHGSVVRRFL